MNNYKSYHSAVKTSYALGIQNQVLPHSFLRSIPRSTASWYRYCLGLGISEKRKPENKSRKKGSVKATRPNQIWHIDVTEFVTSDNV